MFLSTEPWLQLFVKEFLLKSTRLQKEIIKIQVVAFQCLIDKSLQKKKGKPRAGMRDSTFRSHTVTTQGMHDLGRILREESGRKYRKKKYKRHFRVNGKCVCVACLSLS